MISNFLNIALLTSLAIIGLILIVFFFVRQNKTVKEEE